jgi:DNA-binding response OmpR family regulator
MTILVAEDDAVSARVLALALERLGHDVLLAHDGQSAWDLFQSAHCRVIISDWMMPGLSGVDLCRRIRDLALPEYTYFIMITARSGEENHAEAMDHGVDDFLEKPLNRRELEIRLRVASRILSYTSELRAIRRLLPICSYCKKVRTDADYWQEIDAYLRSQEGTDLSHGICPECFEVHLRPQLETPPPPSA